MKRVKVLRGCVADGERLPVNEVVEISDKAFRELSSRGRVAIEEADITPETNLALVSEKKTGRRIKSMKGFEL